jgi:hypothetical protein
MSKRSLLSALTLGAIALAEPAFASFHLMQIEQVIGGVNGDTSRQAIQLRMRLAGQNLVQQGQLVAWDAAGANPVVLLNIGAQVSNSAAGARILIATSNFLPGLTPDFVLANPIPPSYLAAGKITFESDGAFGANVWWGLAWGGASYTGSNTGISTSGVPLPGNDTDGNFNPPFSGALPSSGTTALRFTGAAGALSTNNAADYAVTAGAAQFTNNAGSNGTVPVELLEFKVQ